MSDPVYRIDTEHKPADEWPWKASVYRYSDDAFLALKSAKTEQEAVSDACAWINAQGQQRDGDSYYTDEAGVLVEQP